MHALFFASLLALLATVGHTAAAELPIFDAHLHYSHDAWDNLPPKEAIAIMRKTNPEVAADSATDELVAMREIETTDEIQRVGLGHIDRTRMEKTRDIITSALSLKRSVPLEEIYSADFLPESPIVHSGK